MGVSWAVGVVDGFGGQLELRGEVRWAAGTVEGLGGQLELWRG
jgi:hypothetical protein